MRFRLSVPLEVLIPFVLCLLAIAFTGQHDLSDCWRQPLGATGWEFAACPGNAR
jgi:hypothetical protein